MRNLAIGQKVIQHTINPTLVLNLNQTIDVVNEAVTDILGYLPEQVLGQHISTILSQNLDDQFQLMIQGQTGDHYDDSITVTKHDSDQIPCTLR